MANKTARLGDLATYINGYAFKPADWGDTGLPIIRIQDLTGNSYQLNRYDGEYPERIEVNDGDVLISWSASLGVYVWQRGKALLNQHIFKVVFDKLPVNKEYFVFAVEHKLAEMESKTHGATMKHIVKKDFDGTTIPYPPIEKQAEIADHLRRITSLIDKQTEQLLLLDQLVKSRFIELFGDPASNSPKWDTGRLGDYMTTLTDFSANGSYALLDSQVVMYDEPHYAIMVRTTDLETGDLKNGVKYIDQKAYELLGKSKLFGGEMIMNKIGSAGKIYLMPHIETPASLGRNAFMFRFDQRVNIVFLYALLTSEYGTAEIQQHVRGAVTKTITKESTRSIRIIVPPIELQEQFAAFVEQTDKSKLAVQKGLQELEILKKSLMQQYFG